MLFISNATNLTNVLMVTVLISIKSLGPVASMLRKSPLS